MKKTLLIAIFVLMTVLTVPAQETADCSDLFFSEYVEGSGNNKALEIYNPTNEVVDLSYYFVARFSNGSSTFTGGGYTQLEGFLPAHSVFILVNGQTEDIPEYNSPKCDPALQALAAKYPHLMDHEYPAPTYMNGNDAIVLMKSENKDINDENIQIIDIFGEVGLGNKIEKEYGWSYVQDSLVSYHYFKVDQNNDTTVIETAGRVINYIVQHTDTAGTAPFGPYWMAWTKDHTLIRKPSVKKGVSKNPDGFVVTQEWDTLSSQKDDWSNLGSHTCDCGNTSSVPEPANALPQVYLYPNPVTYNTFEVISGQAIGKVTVMNLLGQEVFISGPIEGGNHSYRVTLPAETPPGFYLVRVGMKNGNSTVRKILVK